MLGLLGNWWMLDSDERPGCFVDLFGEYSREARVTIAYLVGLPAMTICYMLEASIKKCMGTLPFQRVNKNLKAIEDEQVRQEHVIQLAELGQTMGASRIATGGAPAAVEAPPLRDGQIVDSKAVRYLQADHCM